MAKIQYDKKQLPVVVGMGLVSVGLFCVFVWKMTTPPPLQAAPRPGQTASTIGSRAALAQAAAASTANDSVAEALAPSAALKDPFVPAIVDQQGSPFSKPVQIASAKTTENGGLPSVPNLPPVGGLQPLSPAPGSRLPGISAAAPSGPSWTVTGVVSEPTDPRNRMAILRDGDVRRFVRLGDMVDSNFRLVDVSRRGVVLSGGDKRYKLPLGGADSGKSSAKAAAVPASPLLPTGMLAPDFTVDDKDGKPIKLSDYRGKVVVIDFWATWCPPCQKTLPDTNEIARDFAGKQVVVLAINVWDTQDAFQQWLPAHPDLDVMTYGIDTVQKGQYVTGLYKVTGIPTQYVIDKKGKVVTSFVVGDKDDIENAINSALAS